MQAQSASDAQAHLTDVIAAVGSAVEENHYKLDCQFDCHTMTRMQARFAGQADEAEEERALARSLLAEIENTSGPRRAVEAVLIAKRAALIADLRTVLASFKQANLQLYYREREEMLNLEALA